MLALEFFSWWYGRGWADAGLRLRHGLSHLADTFSVAILLRTLFSPWRRIISYPGAGLSNHMRALVDNVVSRCIGFIVRLFVLLAAAVSFILVLAIGSIGLLTWPLLPLSAVGLLIWGIL